MGRPKANVVSSQPPEKQQTGRKGKYGDPVVLATIQRVLSEGGTDKMACAQAGISKETFYQWTHSHPEFSDSCSRARAEALSKAVEAFVGGLVPSKVHTVEVEEYSETRLNRQGKPYQYTKTRKVQKVQENPADWRAGESFLKRRDATDWSDRLLVQVDIKQLTALLALLDKRGITASEAFEGMIQELVQADANSESISTEHTQED